MRKTEKAILITGIGGTLGRAFVRLCSDENLRFHGQTRQQLDIADPDSVERALETFEPWAIVNAAGYVRVDDAEHDSVDCFRANATGPRVLAQVCSAHGVKLL